MCADVKLTLMRTINVSRRVSRQTINTLHLVSVWALVAYRRFWCFETNGFCQFYFSQQTHRLAVRERSAPTPASRARGITSISREIKSQTLSINLPSSDCSNTFGAYSSIVQVWLNWPEFHHGSRARTFDWFVRLQEIRSIQKNNSRRATGSKRLNCGFLCR